MLQQELMKKELEEKESLPKSTLDLSLTDTSKNVDPVKRPDVMSHVNKDALRSTDRNNVEFRLAAEQVRTCIYFYESFVDSFS